MSDFTDQFDASYRLQGTWLDQAATTDKFFPGFENPDSHQVEMAAALTDETADHDIVVNTNPTGAGKTLGWAAPAIASGWITLATYPTNTLIQDQRTTLTEYLRRYFTAGQGPDGVTVETTDEGDVVLVAGGDRYPISDRVRTVSGGTTPGQRTGAAFSAAIEDGIEAAGHGIPTILLTTPDTVVLIGANRYADNDMRALPATVDLIVVDEFHLANPHGRRLLPFHAANFQQVIHGAEVERLAFLSATPEDAYLERLETIADVHVVERPVHDRPPDATESRQILPDATLYVTSERMFNAGERLADGADALIEWAAAAPGQTLVALDSVNEVDQVHAALEEATGTADRDLTVGRIYGWKRRGRESVIDESDIVVGNTAVEVGVDFDDLSRVVCTAYDPASAVQRIGRMRYRDHIDDYEIALLTTPRAHQKIVEGDTQSDDRGIGQKAVDRIALADALNGTLETETVPEYYDLLCGAYAKYLWTAAADPLSERVVSTPGPGVDSAEETYRRLVAGAFAPEGVGPDTFWVDLQPLVENYTAGGNSPVFEEMHTYRPSGLSVLILDRTDPAEPIKSYNLRHVCRWREGHFVASQEELVAEYREVFDELSPEDRATIETNEPYVCGYFVTTGRRSNPREYTITQYAVLEALRERWRGDNPWECTPERLSSATVYAEELDTSHLDLDDEVLIQYVDESIWSARETYSLGAYANLLPLQDDDAIALWQDALLVHAHLVQRHKMNKGIDSA